MALNTKRFLVLDPIVWANLPPSPGFHGMPEHQAKEGALLLLEAGAPPFAGLMRMAERSVFGGFTMDDALDLSAKDASRAEAIAAEAVRQRRIASGHLKVIEPKAKVDAAAEADAKRRAEERARQRERIALSRFPVKRKDGVAAALLVALLEHDGRAQFASRFFDDAGFEAASAANMATTARRLAELGALNCVSRGHARVASTWELTQLGWQNARAIKILKGDDHAGEA